MVKHEASPLYTLLNQIEHAATAGLHLVALGMATALPDMCAALASENGRSNAAKYEAWCEQNLSGERFKFLTGKDLYSIRCGLLHQGRFGGLAHNVERIIFTVGTTGLEDNVVEDAYMTGVYEFVKAICVAVFTWYERERNGDIVRSNSSKLMEYRNGLAPYVTGAVIIT